MVSPLIRPFIIALMYCLIPGSSESQPLQKNDHALRINSKYFQDTLITIHDYQIRCTVYLPKGSFKKPKKNHLVLVLDPDNDSGFPDTTISDSLDSFIIAGNPSAIVFILKKITRTSDDGIPADSDIVSFVSNSLKPFIIRNFHCSVESSVLAGLGSAAPVVLNITIADPGVFERAGIFNGKFERKVNMAEMIDSSAKNIKGMVFIQSYRNDSTFNGNIIQKVVESLGRKSPALLYNFIENRREDAGPYKSFLEFYKWILSNGHSYIINRHTTGN